MLNSTHWLSQIGNYLDSTFKPCGKHIPSPRICFVPWGMHPLSVASDQTTLGYSSEEERARLINMLSALSFLTGPPWVAYFYWIDAYYSASAAFIAFAGGCLSYASNKYLSRQVATHVWMVTALASLALISAVIDHSSNIKALFPVLAIAAFLLFKEEVS